MADSAPSSKAWQERTWRLGLLYAALFLIIGCYLPYMPIWLEWRALDANQIAILLAAPLYVRIVFSPAITFAADRLGNRRLILILLAWGSLGAFLLLWLSSGFWQMLPAAILMAIASTSLMPMVETVAVSGIRRSGLDYGRVRLWGSLSFIGASLGVGVAVQFWGASSVLPLLMVAGAAMVFATYLVPRDEQHREETGTAGRAPTVSRLNLRDAFALVQTPLFLLFLLTASLIQGSHALLYAFGSLHWRAQGFSGGAIGALWSIGVVAEIALFAVSGRVIGRVGSTQLMILAGLAAVLRWCVLSFSPPLWTTGLIQVLHGLSFGAMHLAAIHFLVRAVPEDRTATAQGLYAAMVAGLTMGTMTVVCGPLYTALGGNAYAVMALLAIAGTVAALLLRRRWRGGLVVGDQPQSAGGDGNTKPEA